MGTQIALVKADNWQGLYVAETLVCQDHEIRVEDVMQHVMQNHVDRFQVFDACCDWLATHGNLPESLLEVVLYNGKTVAEVWESE